MTVPKAPVVLRRDRRAELLIRMLDLPLSCSTGAVDSGSGRRRA